MLVILSKKNPRKPLCVSSKGVKDQTFSHVNTERLPELHDKQVQYENIGMVLVDMLNLNYILSMDLKTCFILGYSLNTKF